MRGISGSFMGGTSTTGSGVSILPESKGIVGGVGLSVIPPQAIVDLI